MHSKHCYPRSHLSSSVRPWDRVSCSLGLGLAMQPTMTLNSWSSCRYLPSAENPGMHLHSQFIWCGSRDQNKDSTDANQALYQRGQSSALRISTLNNSVYSVYCGKHVTYICLYCTFHLLFIYNSFFFSCTLCNWKENLCLFIHFTSWEVEH